MSSRSVSCKSTSQSFSDFEWIFSFLDRGGKLQLHGESCSGERQSFHQPNKAAARSNVEDCDADRQKVCKERGCVFAASVWQPKDRADLYRLVLVDIGRPAFPSFRWVSHAIPKWRVVNINCRFSSRDGLLLPWGNQSIISSRFSYSNPLS